MTRRLATAGIVALALGFAPLAQAQTNTTTGAFANPGDGGTHNTATGFQTLGLGVVTGSANTATGTQALGNNTTGAQNNAQGFLAGFSNLGGSFNNFLGSYAGFGNTAGTGNNYIGPFAGFGNTLGSNNVGVGLTTMSGNLTGDNNTAIGPLALLNNTAGSFNTSIGSGSLQNIQGSRNVAIGANAGFNLVLGDDNVYLNAPGSPGDGGVLRLGAPGVQTTTYISGVSGVTTGVGAGLPVVIDTTGQLGTLLSSRRYKTNIADMGDVSDALMQLRPVTFHYTQHGAGAPLQYGLIAEEVEEVLPEAVVHDPESGKVLAVQYDKVNAMLLSEVQRQHQQIEAQELREIREAMARLEALLAEPR